MKSTFSLLLLFCVLFTTAQPSLLPLIRVEGNRFIDPDGKTMVFKGYSSSDPEKLFREGKWEKPYFQELRKWGANIVRFPVHPRAWRSMGEKEYLKLLDKGIALAAEQGIYVIIDWHSIGNLCTEQFFREGYVTTREETMAFWSTIATRYRDNSAVAFLELFNEPTTDNGKLGACSWADWKKLIEEMISIIRKTGNQSIPLVAGFNWGYDLTEIREHPVNAEGIAYVSHPYPQKRPKPWEEKWTEDWGFVSEKYPLILTEIGFCGPDDRGAHIPVISDESYGDAITAYCRERGISYVVWVFDPLWSPMLFSDWNYTPTRQGRYFKRVMNQ